MIAEIKEVHDRVELGWARATGAHAGRLAADYRIEAAAAVRAAREDSVVGDVQAATHRDAWTTQISRLETIYNRDKQQELMLMQLRRNVRELDQVLTSRAPEPGAQRLGLFGAAASVAGFSLRPWMIWSGAMAAALSFGAVQSARLENVKEDLNDSRRDLAQAQDERQGWKERAEHYAAAVTDAREIARQNAAWLEAERRRQARAASEERRRQHEIQTILAGGGDAPAWSLRDDPEVSE